MERIEVFIKLSDIRHQSVSASLMEYKASMVMIDGFSVSWWGWKKGALFLLCYWLFMKCLFVSGMEGAVF